MDTVIKFKVPTLYDALQNGFEFTGRIKLIKKAVTQKVYEQGNEEPITQIIEPAKLLYQCEGCGCFCRPAELVDTSPFDGIPNDWACGGCREKQIRINAKAEIDLIPKPEEQAFATRQEFLDADEQYYRDLTTKRHEVARNFKKGLMQAHGAPKELLDVVGVIDKDKTNRKLPPVAKAAAQVIPAANDVTIEMVDAGNGIQPGKKAKLGDEEVEVTGVNGNQVSVTRPNPVDHPAGEHILFNLEDEEGT
ncbi:MAG: hypothetical protein OQJ95_01005 [Kangiella sp.]|nr:hypothetical protein [Kangiella sp.]MCW9029660.1 hypothetical protein [Kangiella sp.]